MKNYDNDLSNIEAEAKDLFQFADMSSPQSLDQSILLMAKQALHDYKKEHPSQNSTLLSGHFTLMAAADNDMIAAVELIDDEMRTKLQLFEPRDKASPYLLEITPLPSYDNLFSEYYGRTIVVNCGDKEVLRAKIFDDKFTDFVPYEKVQGTRQSWSYRILSGEAESN